MRRSAFQFTIAIPKMWFGHPPQQPEPMGLNKPSRKEACPKTSRYQPAFRPMFAFRPAPMPTRRPCLPGIRISTVAPFRPVSMSTWRPYPSDIPVLSGAHARLMVTFRPTRMLTWCSCSARRSREISAAHTVHGPQELIPHGKNRTACMISRLPT